MQLGPRVTSARCRRLTSAVASPATKLDCPWSTAAASAIALEAGFALSPCRRHHHQHHHHHRRLHPHHGHQRQHRRAFSPRIEPSTSLAGAIGGFFRRVQGGSLSATRLRSGAATAEVASGLEPHRQLGQLALGVQQKRNYYRGDFSAGPLGGYFRQASGPTDGDPKHGFADIEGALFDYLKDKEGNLPLNKYLEALKETGLRVTDPRLAESMRKLGTNTMTDVDMGKGVMLDKATFKRCVSDNIVLLSKAFRHQFIVPEFKRFCRQIDELYWIAKPQTEGKTATYIPQLARMNPDNWGLAICTVDGQRYAIGDANTPFCLQSISKPLTYALALHEEGSVVHQYVGQEPSGMRFNVISLNQEQKPHNPYINAGAIVTMSLVKPDLNLADRFEYVLKMFKRLAGDEFVSFNNSVFLSERATADRNFALGYYLKENKCFPKGTNLHETLDFYFQLCSVEATCDSGAVIAATLANGGVCPINDDKVLEPFCIRDTLSLMSSCGMYDYSGQFAFKVGLPAKSGVAGGIMLVIPNIMGIAMWSPPLDVYGNSVRGIHFCQDLVNTFNFHNYDNIRFTARKLDPCIRNVEIQTNKVVDLLFSAYNGDVTAIRRCALSGMDLSQPDYDGRTALHVASAEGQMSVVEFLLERCNCSPFVVDRWGFLPLDDAIRFKKNDVVQLLQKTMLQQRPDFFKNKENHHQQKQQQPETDNTGNSEREIG